MNKLKRRYGTWALVAGGALGLGAAYSRSLAKYGFNVIIVDRLVEKMRQLAEELQNQYKIEVLQSELDLNESGAAQQVYALADKVHCRLIVYNAAYGPVKAFRANTLDELDYYINVNSRTLLKLIHCIAGQERHGERSGFVIMSSLAGLWGTQLVAPYSATKAFDLALGEALYHELKDHGMDILVCCAGATDTPNYQNTKPAYGWPRPNVLSPEKVAAYALKNLGSGPLCIPGVSNKLTYFVLNHLLPKRWALFIMNRTMVRMYRHRL